MPTKTKKAKKIPTMKRASLADQLGSIADSFDKMYQIENVADNLASVGVALDHLAEASAMSVIAEYGTEEDRKTAVDYLKRRYEEF